MASSSYRNFVRLLQMWPVDATKEGIDLGQYIRNRVAESFKHGDLSSINETECRKTYESLHRLATNHYGDRYARAYKSCATGISGDLCRKIVSKEAMAMYRVEEKSLTSRLKNLFKTTDETKKDLND